MTSAIANTISELVSGTSHSTAFELRTLGFDVATMNKDYALVLVGGKSAIVKENVAGPLAERLQFLSIDAFNTWFRNRDTEVLALDGRRKVVSWARAWLNHPNRRQYSGVEFFPNADGAEPTPDYLNLWRGFSVLPSAEGSYAIFRDHLINNVCQSDEALFKYVLGWFAHMMQRPRDRVGTALVLRGGMGTGKTKVGEVFGSLIAAHYFQVDDPRYVTGHFNAHMGRCLFLQAEEAVWAGDKQAEGILKGLITSEQHMIEAKGIDPIQMKNYVHLLMTSNEDWVVPAGKDERRFCVLDVHPRCAQNHDYFREMQSELDQGGRERLLYDLLNFDLSTVELRRIPRTAALLEQKLRHLDTIETWWLERLMAGSITRRHDEWRDQVPCEEVYQDYLVTAKETGINRRLHRAAFGTKLKKIVPEIDRSRPRVMSDDGEQRPYCYLFPPLARCREAFEDSVGQGLVWPKHAACEDSSSDNVAV